MIHPEDGPNRKVVRSRKRSISNGHNSSSGNHGNDIRNAKHHKTDSTTTTRNGSIYYKNRAYKTFEQDCNVSSNEKDSDDSDKNILKKNGTDSVWFANSFNREKKITSSDSAKSSKYFSQTPESYTSNVCSVQTDHVLVQRKDDMISSDILNSRGLSSTTSVRSDMKNNCAAIKTSTPQKDKKQENSGSMNIGDVHVFSSGDSILDSSDMWLADLDMQAIDEDKFATEAHKSEDNSYKMIPSDYSKTQGSDKHPEITGCESAFEDSFSGEDFLKQIQENNNIKNDCQDIHVSNNKTEKRNKVSVSDTIEIKNSSKNSKTISMETEDNKYVSDNSNTNFNLKTNCNGKIQAGSRTIDNVVSPAGSGTNTNLRTPAGSGTNTNVGTQAGSWTNTNVGTPAGSGTNNNVRTTASSGTNTNVGAAAGSATNNKVRTPAGSGSLRDRIKQRLQENVGSTSPKTPGSTMQQMRDKVVQKAQVDAELIQKEFSDVDIGPFYGLPTKVQQLLESHRGIKQLYDWQNECLKLPAVLDGKNLIYSLPTSGGKTLVAEILILRELLCKQRDALLILPFVSIVQEKVRNMSHFAVDLDFLVEEYAGSKGKFPPIKRRKKKSLFIATIEKGHSLINSLTEQGRLDSLGLVVIDELHMLGEGGSRGATLESSLLKIIYSQNKTQIIGMSATLNNIKDLQIFLKAEVYSNDFRPVTLTEYVKLQDSIFEIDTKTKCPDDLMKHDRVVTFQYKADMTKVDSDHLFGLVMEVIPDNSCLLFCPTKKNCENVALMLCKLMAKHKQMLSTVKKQERKSLLKELYTDGDKRICPVLQYTIHFGVAYHHSGLTTDERKLIEEAYSDGILCLLTCTSTLAAGVNLPAKRVVLRCPYVGSQFISRSQYKQMVGRAGRAGIDDSGESILIIKLSDTEKVNELLSGPIESCHSSLMYDGGKGIRNLLLSAIGLQITPSTSDVFNFMSKTLLSVQSQEKSCDITNITKESLQSLVNLGLVIQKKVSSQDNSSTDHYLEVTPLGKATFKGSIDLDYTNQLYKDLKKAEESLFLSSHLHLLYLVTPYDLVQNIKPSWTVYFQQMNTLSPVELKVAGLIGVPESYITKKASGQVIKQTVDDMVVSRFYLTLMLYDLWKQKSIWEVSELFQQPRGLIQNLLSSSASFASCVHHFCQELEEFWAYQDLLGNFVKRLSYCVTAELIPLMEIPGVKLGRAKQLFNAGYKNLSIVAHADPENIVKSLKQIPRRVATQIVASAKILLNEKAEALMEEVEELVTIPTDFPGAKTPVISSQDSGGTLSLSSSPFNSQ